MTDTSARPAPAAGHRPSGSAVPTLRLPGPTRPAPPATVAWLAVLGAAGELLVRAGPGTAANGVLAAAVAAVLWRRGLLRTRASRVTAALAVGFAALAGLRASPWLVPLDLLAAAGLLAVAASTARGGRLDDAAATVVAGRGARLVLSALRAPGWATSRPAHRRSARRGRPTWAVVRGLALAAPVTIVVAVLLASGDVVFASLLDVRVTPQPIVGHVALAVVVWLSCAALAVDAASPPPRIRPPARVLGAVEAATVLACLVAVLGAFAGTQLVTLAGGADHVLRTAGLTRAEYARSGFFQLLAVSAVLLATMAVLRSVVRADPGRDRLLRRLQLAAIGLTLAVVAVAIGRIVLYVDAFGLTMLRLYTVLFAGWLGVVVAALAAAVAGVRAGRRWVLPFAAASGLALLLALNVADPEAAVARHNVAVAAATGRLDAGYLAAELSADAVPALLDAAPTLDAAQRDRLLTAVCGRMPEPVDNPWSANLARWRAARALAATCPGPA